MASKFRFNVIGQQPKVKNAPNATSRASALKLPSNSHLVFEQTTSPRQRLCCAGLNTICYDISILNACTSRMPSRAERLAQIRALRAAGKTGFDAYEVQEAESIYETVDDEAYKKVVRSRLDQDDFVVDDNGEGYADDGREDWQDEGRMYEDSESEEDLSKHSKAGKYCYCAAYVDLL